MVKITWVSVDSSEVDVSLMETFMEIGKKGYTDILRWEEGGVLVATPTGAMYPYNGQDDDLDTIMDYMNDRDIDFPNIDLEEGIMTLATGQKVELVL